MFLFFLVGKFEKKHWEIILKTEIQTRGGSSYKGVLDNEFVWLFWFFVENKWKSRRPRRLQQPLWRRQPRSRRISRLQNLRQRSLRPNRRQRKSPRPNRRRRSLRRNLQNPQQLRRPISHRLLLAQVPLKLLLVNLHKTSICPQIDWIILFVFNLSVFLDFCGWPHSKIRRAREASASALFQ